MQNETMIPSGAKTITPHDTNTVGAAIGFMIPTDGDVAIVCKDGSAVTLPACKAGVQYVIAFTIMKDAGTTPTSAVVFL